MFKIASLFAALAVLGFTAPAGAQDFEATPEGAVVFVQDLVDNVLAILRDKTVPVAERESLLAVHLREGFALDYIGRFALGRHWRKASPGQRREYQALFTNYIIKSYGIRLDEYANQNVVVGRALAAGKRDLIVSSSIVRADGPPLSIDWRVRPRDGAYKVIDIKVEGISMAISQREEFSAVVQQSGIDGLIASLRGKVDNAASQSAAAAEAGAPH